MLKIKNMVRRIPKKGKVMFFVPIIILVIATAWIFLGGGRGGPGEPIPYLESCLTDEELAEFDIEKYREIFESDSILDAMSPIPYGNFRTWEPEMQCQLVEDILFYESTDESFLPVPYDGACVIDGGGERCYTVTSGDAGVTYMRFNSDYAQHLTVAKLAWHLFVEANDMTGWSLFDYSDANLRLLFDAVPGQPRQGRQYFTAELYIPETYLLVGDGLKLAHSGDPITLTDVNTRETVLSLLEFLGNSLTHFAGSTRITMSPRDSFWPYSARGSDGSVLYDEEGIRIPLDRLPTTEEILLQFEPHHHDPDYYDRERLHIIGGCWASSVLIKNMLASVNIPVDILNNFDSIGGFAGHSGVRFPDLEGEDYYLNHSDDIYDYGWKYGLLDTRDRIDASEIWETGDFSPFDEYLDGYGVLHDENAPWYLSELDLDEESIGRIQDEFGRSFGGFGDISSRILAVRSVENPSIQSIYKRCVSTATPESIYLPTGYLTDDEEAQALSVIDAIVAERRAAVPGEDDCMELFFMELYNLYYLKTGVPLVGDTDGDGKKNFEDRYPFIPDDDPSRPSEFWDVIGMH